MLHKKCTIIGYEERLVLYAYIVAKKSLDRIFVLARIELHVIEQSGCTGEIGARRKFKSEKDDGKSGRGRR